MNIVEQIVWPMLECIELMMRMIPMDKHKSRLKDV
ncbi:hypothetical protein KT99_01359 [Shewanella benthica KT99]|uniref:Uncharacterized protein n=1 Tax=Shewanella benthica KT99 TaxID=314608 RepID=A9DGE1_9GAMM|nr:hypothetical protein KT99_01359 [Shewanella benthica KT99]